MSRGIVEIKNRYFRIALFWSIMSVVGIPMIVFGAIHLPDGFIWILMMIIGIVFTGGAIFALPLLWIGYASKKRLARVCVVVSGSQSLTIDVLSDTLGRSQQETREDVRTCLQNGWLPGYAFVDQEDRVTATSFLDLHHAVCEYCHASFEYRGTDAKCPYCGRFFTGKPLD